jgi:hypothetical protein
MGYQTRQYLYNTETHYCDGAPCNGCEHLIEEENLAMIEFSIADAERRVPASWSPTDQDLELPPSLRRSFPINGVRLRPPQVGAPTSAPHS